MQEKIVQLRQVASSHFSHLCQRVNWAIINMLDRSQLLQRGQSRVDGFHLVGNVLAQGLYGLSYI